MGRFKYLFAYNSAKTLFRWFLPKDPALVLASSGFLSVVLPNFGSTPAKIISDAFAGRGCLPCFNKLRLK